jgi:hypothetical protein
VGKGGISVGEPLENLRGVLTGVPSFEKGTAPDEVDGGGTGTGARRAE